MAKSSAERRREYVEKLKSTGEYENYKKKRAVSEKKRRDSRKHAMNSLPQRVKAKILREKRELVRRRVAECRERKKELLSTSTTSNTPDVFKTSSSSITSSSSVTSSSSITSASSITSSSPERGFSSVSALNKAVAKLKRAAPKSMEKRKEAVRKLLLSFDVKDREEIISGKVGQSGSRTTTGLSASVIESVKAFYERDDVSLVSSNVKDCRNFVNPVSGLKERKQIRYLMYKVNDVYDMFLREVRKDDESMEPPLKSSKFFELRPEHVKLVRNKKN